MLCGCIDPWSDPQSAYNRQASDDELTSYPGQRRKFSTEKKSLAGAPPPPLGNFDQHLPLPDARQQPPQGDLLSVTVPPGISSGRTIHVAHPDGSGRLVRAIVPPGITTGDKFMVRLPPPAQAPSAKAPSAVAEPMGNYSRVDSGDYSSPSWSPMPFSQALDNPKPPMANFSPPASPSDPVGKSLLRVQVPPGAAPGSTIHLQVPGENRVIAAQVPPNCTEFHVQYESRVHHKQTHNITSHESNSPPGQKLLLVRVPAGATTGNTLHVQVPNEPGRVLQAQVPPGQLKAFHVSYQPQQPNNNAGCVSAALPIVGGIATGTTATVTDGHFAHATDGRDDQDQGY